jgi:hypothetical protein
MSEISPAAKAVMDAVVKVYPAFPDEVAAAALRAAITAVGAEEMFHPTSKRTEGVKWCVQRIYAIADELEVQYPIN